MRLIDADEITEDERQEHGFFYNSDLQELLDEQPTIDISNTSNTLGALDCVSRQWLMECVNEGWIKFDTEKDENRFIHLVRDIAPSVQLELSNNSTKLDNKNGELISRQEAVDVLNRGLSKIPYVNNTDEEMIRRDERIGCIQEVAGLPTVPRKGEWICQADDDIWNCSECDYEIDGTGCIDPLEYLKTYKFCPNCGASMRPQFEEPEINPCRGCEDYDGKGGCKTKGGCADRRGDSDEIN